MNKIEQFIDNFKTFHKKELEDTFLNANCYWFADILERQFGGEKYYEATTNHFIIKIDEDFYDIRGKIEPDDNIDDLIKWSDYHDYNEEEYYRILKYCKNLEN